MRRMRMVYGQDRSTQRTFTKLQGENRKKAIDETEEGKARTEVAKARKDKHAKAKQGKDDDKKDDTDAEKSGHESVPAEIDEDRWGRKDECRQSFYF